MAHFNLMGADSVAYHLENTMDRGDDHPGQAIDYYGSRGETPLRWAGPGAERLGLSGIVTTATYEALFGPGGPRDPITGKRLVSVKRPGVELVIDTHKSVAILGVIGRADDMHAVVDAETEGTMAVIEPWFKERGGRRGREQRRTPTGGLTYAVTRHATSREGDPQPHDHALITNLVEMRDTRGGWKALDTAAVRDLATAAERVGHLYGAAEAIRRGYRIARDDGDSGLKHAWRIVGIPHQVADKFSKRKRAVDEFMDQRGYDTLRARKVAALRTRPPKRYTSVDEELMPRWHAELAEMGYSVEALNASLDHARGHHPGHNLADNLDHNPEQLLGGPDGLAAPLTAAEIEALAGELFDPRGDFLRRTKVFTRTRLIEHVAPALYGHDPAELDPVLDRLLGSSEIVPLVGVAAAREQTYTTATILATEARIAASVQRLATQPYPAVTPAEVETAIAAKAQETGHPFTAGQHAAAHAVARSGRRVNVVVGVAGSGKTTMLHAVITALENAGHQVIGSSTSGQATRTLRDEAQVEANTVAKLLWRLDHGQLTLDKRTILVLDEAAMTADADLLRLVLGVERAGGKLVLVGDHQQLAAIGPGGALQAVIERHPHIATPMTENVRQADPGERRALGQLRAGDVDQAIDWYTRQNRAVVAPSRLEALVGMVDAWAADLAAGHNAIMLAYRRQDVFDLNRLARHQRRHTGHLVGPDMAAPGGCTYAVGDRVVLLAPNNPKGLVTSERATVAAIHPQHAALTVTSDAGRRATLAGVEIDQDHLDWGYAITVHRTQAATVGRAHLFADGGGRQLAYVAMSRARERSTVHAVADTLAQALDDIRTDWGSDRRQQWVTDTARPGASPRPLPDDPAARAARLRAELDELDRAAPPNVAQRLGQARTRLDKLRQDRRDLDYGSGRWTDTPAGRAARAYQQARRDHHNARQQAEAPGVGWRQRRRWAKTADQAAKVEAFARDDWQRLVEPVADRLDREIAQTKTDVAELEDADQFRQHWLDDHPDHAQRIQYLRRELLRIEDPDRARILDRLDQVGHQPPTPGRDLGGIEL